MAKNIVLPHNVEDITKCPPFGRLKAISYAGRNSHGDHTWDCVCKCGKSPKRPVATASLKSGNTRSCGCLKADLIRQRPPYKHGWHGTPEYHTWARMKARCNDVNHDDYHNYGGRGIRVCERWLHSFENFLADMGPRPSPKHSIDRFPNNNGDYGPGNCRWATVFEQQRNTRGNRLVTYDGITMCVAAWAEKVGIPPKVIYDRLNRGWSEERALTSPVGYRPKSSLSC